MQKINDNIALFESILGEWKIGNVIERGSYGNVYKMSKEISGKLYLSTLKVLSIPNEILLEDVNTYMGISDPQETLTYFEEVVKEVEDEIKKVHALRANDNIVQYDKHFVLKREDGTGWDIIIQMENVKPLRKSVNVNELTPDDVVKIAMDLTNALKSCEDVGMIHGYIREENIFVSESGKYKLGNFDIEYKLRNIGHTDSKGNTSYLPREVYAGAPMNKTTDIYCLGLVLYKLLNYGRFPFLPLYPQDITVDQVEEALAFRLTKPQFPKPQKADEKLSSIVLKSCSFKQEDRYQSVKAMIDDLSFIFVNADSRNTYLYKNSDEITILYEKPTEINVNPEETGLITDLEFKAFIELTAFKESTSLKECDTSTFPENESQVQVENDKDYFYNEHPSKDIIFNPESDITKRRKESNAIYNSNIENSRNIGKILKNKFVVSAAVLTVAVGLLGILAWSVFGQVKVYGNANGEIKFDRSSLVKSTVSGKVTEVNFQDNATVKQGDILFTIAVDNNSINQIKEIKDNLTNSKANLDSLNKLKQSVIDGVNRLNYTVKEEKDNYNKYVQYDKSLRAVLGRDIKAEETPDQALKRIRGDLSDINTFVSSVSNNKNLFTDASNNYSVKFEQYMREKSKMSEAEVLTFSDQKIKKAKDMYEPMQMKVVEYDNKMNSIKNSMLTQVNQNISDLESLIQNLDKQWNDATNSSTEFCKFNSPISGTLEFIKTIHKGDIINSGDEILNLVPSQNKYIIQYSVSSDVRGLKEGQEIALEVLVFSQKGYKSIVGRLKTISPSSNNSTDSSLTVETAADITDGSIIESGVSCSVMYVKGIKSPLTSFVGL